MLLSEVIERLTKILEKEGDMQTTCTGALIPDSGLDKLLPDVYETTVENFIILTEANSRNAFAGEKRLRIYK